MREKGKSAVESNPKKDGYDVEAERELQIFRCCQQLSQMGLSFVLASNDNAFETSVIEHLISTQRQFFLLVCTICDKKALYQQ